MVEDSALCIYIICKQRPLLLFVLFFVCFFTITRDTITNTMRPRDKWTSVKHSEANGVELGGGKEGGTPRNSYPTSMLVFDTYVSVNENR